MQKFGLIVALVLITSPISAQEPGASEAPVPSVEFLDQVEIPSGARLDDACIGGLSGLTYDAESDRFYAVADARREARFFRLRIPITTDAAGRSKLGEVAFEQAILLRSREGEPYADGVVDPEGIVWLGDGTLWISSEGVATRSIAPFVDRVEAESGAWSGSVPVPLDYVPQHDGELQIRGVRNNRGFEGLASSPDRRQLFVGTEASLAQDDLTRLEPGDTFYGRLLRYHLEKPPRLGEELLYPLVQPAGDDVVAFGLTELLALDDQGHLLALERVARGSSGVESKLFELRLDERSSPAALSRAANPDLSTPQKSLILDFDQAGLPRENYEAMTLGPRLADGGESLLILGDNDNPYCKSAEELDRVRPTRLLLFRLRR